VIVVGWGGGLAGPVLDHLVPTTDAQNMVDEILEREERDVCPGWGGGCGGQEGTG